MSPFSTDASPEGRWASDRRAIALLVLAWLVVVALVGLGGDFPINDDWAYAWSARHFAATGQMRILDWAAPSLVSHIAWGAALVKLFGASYVVLRAGTLAWGLGGLLVLFRIGRQSAFSTEQSLMLALAVGLSPWYVNLSFSYMSDVPWLVMVLGAISIALGRGGGVAWRCLGAGLCLGVATLCRQFAILTVPGFVLLFALDARREGGAWLKRATLRTALFLLPLAILFGGFSFWYFRVHGPTLAYRMTLHRRWSTRWLSLAHVLAVWHYLGFWVLPWVAALYAARRARGVVGRRIALVSTVCLVGYGVVAWVGTRFDPTPALGLNGRLPPTFPYLSNLVYVLGAGPLTLYDTYMRWSPYLHQPRWLGYALSALSTVGGVYFAAWLVRALGRLRGALVHGSSDGTPESRPRDRALVVLLGAMAPYLAWQVAMSPFLFDRYIFVVMPAAVWIALDALPARLAASRASLAALGLLAVFSVGATHEYLAWNGARDQAVRDLEALGVPSAQIDGGFEVNGPRHFEDYFRRTGTLGGGDRADWWVVDARWRIAFWPDAIPGCRDARSYPFWTWPGTGPRAIHVLDCAGAPSPATNAVTPVIDTQERVQ